jgi:hypothetical protein
VSWDELVTVAWVVVIAGLVLVEVFRPGPGRHRRRP